MDSTQSNGVRYAERTVIPLPNGDKIPATVSVIDHGGKAGVWTHIKPDVGVVIPASGIAAEVGDTEDFIYDLDARGVKTARQMVETFLTVWQRDQENAD